MSNISKTPEEISALKHNWFGDPIWDIELTEGFEDYKDELLKYRLECEEKWEQAQEKKLVEKADTLGLLNNIALVEYIMGLEAKIETLEAKVDQMYYQDTEDTNKRLCLHHIDGNLDNNSLDNLDIQLLKAHRSQ
jgi:hypothetical protein